MIQEEHFKLILLIGAVLTFMMAFFLWFYPRNFFSNKVLGVLTFFWGLTVLSFVFQSKEFYAKYPHLLGLGTSLILLFFPLMYMYIKTFLYKDSRQVRKFILHFIPMLAFLIAFSPFYFQGGAVKSEIILAGIPQWLRGLFKIADMTIVAQGIFYTVISVRLLQHFQYFRSKRLSKVQLSAVQWLKQFVIINIFLWAIGTSGAMLELSKVSFEFDLFKVYYLGLTVLTLWMGYFTLQKPHLFSEGQSIRYMTLEVKAEKESSTKEGEENNQDLENLMNYLNESKPFLNNEMALQDLVDGTGLTKHRISEVLNNELRKSFYDIINEYRTKEAMRLMDEGLHKDHTLTHLAEMAGFNSKATFNRIFKKNTGKTPSQYINSLS